MHPTTHANTRPDHPAIIMAASGRVVTFGEMDAAANRVAQLFRSRGIGRLLMERALKDAKAKGHALVLLVGDEPYYSRVGFKQVPKGRVTMPGPVDAARILVFELVDDAFEGVAGAVAPDWSKARG